MLRTLRALSVTLAACWFCAAAVSAAERGAEMRFDIPAQSLDGALNALAEAAGVQLSYSGALSEELRSPTLSGDYTVAQALDQLLEGTGLGYRFVDHRTLTLERPDPLAALVAEARTPMDYAGAAEPAPKKPQAPVRKSEYGPTVLPEMTVTASPTDETSYNVPNATTATKTNTPIMETPVSIQVVPQQVLQDQQAMRVEDAVKNVSGVQSSFNYGDEGSDFFIRGFNTNYNVFRNGFRTSGSFGTPGTANVERIEVLKGPAAVLYGRIEPGGLINLVTKRSLFSPYYSIQQQFGSYDLYRTTLDAAGPLLSDSALAYRFNFEYLDTNSFRDFVSTERIFVAPSLTWRPREDTEVNLLVEYARVYGPEDQGIPAIGNRPAPLPISRSLVGPNNTQTADDIQLYLTASHQLNEAWTVRGGFSGYWNDYHLDYLFHGGLQDDDRTIDLFPNPVDNNETRYALYLDATGHFETFGTTHDVLLGADYYLMDREFLFWFGNPIPQDIFNPRVFNFDYAPLRATTPAFILPGQEWVGIYFQDQITLWDKVHLLGGGRYDWADTLSGFSRISLADAEATEDKRTDRKFSPRVGLLYQPWSWLSLYGNYVESLGSNNGRNSTGSPLDPQLATQYEVGAKTEFFDGRLNATLAFYHLTKENLPAADLSTPDPSDSVTIGEARSRGIEFDVSGQITDRVSVFGSYSYIDAKITRDPRQDEAGNPLPGNEGHQLLGAPRHSGSLWTKYALVPERLDVGAGVFAAGQRQGDFENTFQLPGYVRLDAYAAYHWKIGPTKMTAQVNINNLLDKEYFSSTNQFDGNPRTGIIPAEPLTVLE